MVSTRGHPEEFPEPDLSPSRASPARTRKTKWAHTPSNLTLIWLMISLPLVAWDTGYVLLRPHSMPGGWLHAPLWLPYALYVEVDYMYGWKAFNEHNGFTSAQAFMNIIESLLYVCYLYILYAHGKPSKAPGRGAPKPSTVGYLGQQRSVGGKLTGPALLVAYSASVITVAKTLLYGLNEYFSGFENVGHNSALNLTFLWIIPNGAWIVLPAYMMYVSGIEILQGLALAANGPVSPDEILAIKGPLFKSE